MTVLFRPAFYLRAKYSPPYSSLDFNIFEPMIYIIEKYCVISLTKVKNKFVIFAYDTNMSQTNATIK